MKQNTTIKGGAARMDAAADYIRRKYEAKGFAVGNNGVYCFETCNGNVGWCLLEKHCANEHNMEDVVFGICNTGDGFGSFCKRVVGYVIYVNLVMKKKGEDLDVEVETDFVVIDERPPSIFFNPLPILTVGLRFYKRNKLQNQVYLDILGFFANAK